MKSVKLVGGPMDSRMVDLPASADVYRVGSLWVYEYAGKDGRQTLFAKRSRSRHERRFARFYVQKFGKHPVVAMAESKPKPVRVRP
jgi:hypothetical protein